MCDVTLYWGWKKGEGKIFQRVDNNVFSTFRIQLLECVGFHQNHLWGRQNHFWSQHEPQSNASAKISRPLPKK